MTLPPVASVSGRRRAVRKLFGLAALVVAMFTLFPVSAASAHAFLAASNPADGATLAAAPAELRMSFSESVVLDALTIDIVDSQGRHYRPTAMHFVSAATASTEEPAEIVGKMPPLAHDAYRMSWQTLSSDDLHRTNGVLIFGIGRPVSAAGTVEPAPRVDEAVLRAAILLSLSLTLGGLLAARLLRQLGDRSVLITTGRCRRWARRGAFAGIVCATGLLLDQVMIGGIAVDTALVSGYGGHVITRLVGFAMLLLAAAGPRRWADARHLRSALVVAGAAAVGIATVLMGHAGAGLIVSTTRVAADAAHLLAAATWSGTLFLAVFVVLPAARRSAADPAGDSAVGSVREMLRAFGIPAGICMAVMVVTGLYLTGSVVGSVDALLLTFYGRTLVIKLVVVAFIGALGLINTRRLRNRGARQGGRAVRMPARTVGLEAGAAALVLILAALLTSSQPALEPQFVAAPVAVPVRDGATGDLQQSVAVRPNIPGKNVILIGVFDTRKPSPAAIRTVSVILVGPDGRSEAPMRATGVGDHQWSVTADIGSTTHYTIVVTVARPGLGDEIARYPWVVSSPPGQTRPATVSNAPIGSAARTASGILLLVVLLGLLAVIAIRRLIRRKPDDISEVPARRADMADTTI